MKYSEINSDMVKAIYARYGATNSIQVQTANVMQRKIGKKETFVSHSKLIN